MDLRKRLQLGNVPARERGSLIHAWFELIEWLDDGEPDDAALRDAARRSGVRRDNMDELMDEFRAMLRQPSIRNSLVRPTGSSTRCFELWRERPFVIRLGDSLLNGKFDRVVVTLDGSRASCAEVVDFKTDAVAAADAGRLETLVEHYRPQVEAYRAAAGKLAGLEASRVSARLLFVTAAVVRKM